MFCEYLIPSDLAAVCCWGLAGEGVAPVNEPREPQRGGNQN